MEVDTAWLIPSLPPKRQSRRPGAKKTIEVQMDWLEDEPKASKPGRGPPPLPAVVRKPSRRLPPPLPREDPPEPRRARTSTRPRKR